MKTFKLAPEVEAKISSLVSELHDVCSENHVPYVCCVVVANDDIKISKRFSAFVKTEEDLADNSLIAGCEFLKMTSEEIPNELITGLLSINGMQNGCDCPECQARRAAALH